MELQLNTLSPERAPESCSSALDTDKEYDSAALVKVATAFDILAQGRNPLDRGHGA